ncbi:MAG: NAD(+)/NADH kinase [Bacteroidota bacterium]|nr:NAD(+)/NADH kinase [Bacteroidota bacterium]
MTSSRETLVFGIMGNYSKDVAVAAIARTVDFLIRRRIPFILEEEILQRLDTAQMQDDCCESASRDGVAQVADVVITFGGDGTLLGCVQHTLPHETPVLGVNLGKLGFLSDVGVDEVFWAIEQILEGNYSIERRMTITGHLQEDDERFHALNDIVLAKNGSTKVVSVDAYVDGDFLASFVADGLIVSTPTGSTAYSLATGGPVVVPSSGVIIISPISAHTLTARPVIVSGDSTIDVCARTEDGSVMVMADGRYIREHESSIEVQIARGAHPVVLVKGLGPRYFETLRRKLIWAQDGRLTDAGSAPNVT